MSLHLIKPHYPCEPITSVPKLALALGFDELVLRELAHNASTMYRKVKPKLGSTRQTFDAQGLLKSVHESVKNRILSRVCFPPYLHGSLKGCDYVTNASLHTKKKIIICEDVKSFFPSVRIEQVTDIWQNFFLFTYEVARLLAALTTKDGAIPQGAKTSSYLANLVFWRDEPYVQAKLAQDGIAYSRYVDDIAISSPSYLSKSIQTKIIADVYGMLRKRGLYAARKKHEVFSDSGVMKVTKLIVNRKPSLSKQKRSQVRAQAHRVTSQSLTNATSVEAMLVLNKAAQSVGQLGRLHPVEAAKYKKDIQKSRNILEESSTNAATI